MIQISIWIAMNSALTPAPVCLDTKPLATDKSLNPQKKILCSLKKMKLIQLIYPIEDDLACEL